MTGWSRKGTEIKPLEGDKVSCDTCTLAPACYAAQPGEDCAMSDTRSGVWAGSFETGLVDDLDKGLAQILKLQAVRAQSLLEEELPEDISYKDKVKHEERIDRNLDKLYRNALAFRTAKAPSKAVGSRVIDPDGNEQLPPMASPQLMAEALRELEEVVGIPRENITRGDVLSHLAAQNKIALPAGSDEEFF